MDWWIWLGIAAIVVVAIALAVNRGWVDFSDKTRRGGGGGGALLIGDEVFAPRKHEAQAELDRQTLLPAPAPLPGDGDKGIAFADTTDVADDALPEPVADPVKVPSMRRVPVAAPRETGSTPAAARFDGRIRLDLE